MQIGAGLGGGFRLPLPTLGSILLYVVVDQHPPTPVIPGATACEELRSGDEGNDLCRHEGVLEQTPGASDCVRVIANTTSSVDAFASPKRHLVVKVAAR
ncbi:MAG TPA: hypothetical protein VNJ04_00145 [Gemmatimonadaceae bacterium]|nr:hypothetical protein [Gemmatimonadaceae bacterium]